MMKEPAFFEQLSTVGIHLNEEQREAVRHVAGPLVVFAGPGSGKTTVLTCRTAYLLQVAQVYPGEMLIVTFTRAAAEEMQSRVAAMPGIGQQAVRAAEIGTFHSVFMRMLVQNNGRVPQLIEDAEQRTIIRNLLREQGQDGDDEEVAEALQKIGLCKNNLIMPDRIKATKPENQKFRDLFSGYEEAKRKADRWDYDDILVQCYYMLKSNPAVLERYQRRFRYILVDEFQDTNLAQYEVIKLLGAHGNVCIVGDDDQSIYRFRGSRVEFLLDFESTFSGAKKVILATNYRSIEPVIETSSRLILHNRKRQSKKLRGTGRTGAPPVLIRPEGEKDEAETILDEVARLLEAETEPQHIAVLYRTNIQVRAMIDGLVARNLPFTLYDADGDFYRRWQVRDVLTYFQLALDPDDLDHLVQIINRPKRYLYMDRLIEEVHHLRKTLGVSYLEALRRVESLETYQQVKIGQLKDDLNKIKFQMPALALKTIRKEIGYDKYLEEYAAKSGNELKMVSEPLDELEQAVAGHKTITDFLAHVQEVNETIRKSRNQGDGVQLMTMHRAKGLEFEHVYCIGLVEDMLPHPKSLTGEGEKRDSAVEEERRLLYVGMTRAKRFLTLSAPLRYHGHRAEPSPFLYETALLERPKRVAIASSPRDTLAGSLSRSRGSSGGRFVAKKDGGASEVPPNERMKLALERYGETPFAVGDSLVHKEFGPGTIETIKSLSGQNGRRAELRFEGKDKLYDLHLELCLYLELLNSPVGSVRGKG